jgi:hypothetical protein
MGDSIEKRYIHEDEYEVCPNKKKKKVYIYISPQETSSNGLKKLSKVTISVAWKGPLFKSFLQEQG